MSDERRLAATRITVVATRLHAIRDQLVFIGGTVLPLLVDVDARFHAPRMTGDVDAVGVAATYTASAEIEAAITAAGYRLDVTARHKGRWIGPDDEIFDLSFAGNFVGASGATVDQFAIETAVPMAGHPTVRHLSPTGLLLMKCAAFADRGRMRPQDSKDLADLGVLLVGTDPIADVQQWSSPVRQEVRTRAAQLRALPSLEALLLGHFADRYPKPPDTAEELALEAIAVLEALLR